MQTHIDLITIDPGVHGFAVARWVGGVLDSAWLSAFSPVEGKIPARSILSTRAGGQLGYPSAAIFPKDPARVVIECPQIYATRHQKGSQQDLIDLAVVVGQIKERAIALGHTVDLVLPREWKGQTPKEVSAQRVNETLSPLEWRRISLGGRKADHHNVYDAIHMGLVILGRSK